ncbi:MAG: hypothetical protein ABID83_02530 [Candidatus Omnitrophota bacterium]
MKKAVFIFLIALIAVSFARFSHAAEDTISKPASVKAKTPSDKEIRQVVKSYIEEEVKKNKDKTFKIKDPVFKETRSLSLMKLHQKPGKADEYYHLCADFQDLNDGEFIDVDFDVQDVEGSWEVVDAVIHKVGGKARFIYDKNGNRIPLRQ